MLHARWTNVNGLPAVSVFENPLYGIDGLLKRATDFVLGALLTAAAAVPIAARVLSLSFEGLWFLAMVKLPWKRPVQKEALGK